MKLSISLTENAGRQLRRLHATGLYGVDLEHAAETLIAEGIARKLGTTLLPIETLSFKPVRAWARNRRAGKVALRPGDRPSP